MNTVVIEQKNRYYRRSHITERKLRQLLDYFALDLSAAEVAQLTGLTRKTVNVIFLKIRRRLADTFDSNATISRVDLELARQDYLERVAVDSEELAAENGNSFRGFARRRLMKFRGVAGHTLDLHVKECAWRHGKNRREMLNELLKMLHRYPL
jgi:transposase-like protein